MLRYEVNHATGIPQTAVRGFAPTAEADHWTAGGVGRAGALATIRGFQLTRTTRNASYHLLLWHLCTDHVTGAMEIVPLTKASHSMNPATAWQLHPDKSRTLQESRFAEVRRILGAKANDPNAGSISVSFCGMPADLAKAMACPIFRADARALSALLRRKVPTIIARPHFGHGWIQPISRFEMDAPGVDYIGSLYSSEEDDMQFWKPVQEDWWTADGTVFYDGDGTRKTFTDRERVQSTAESGDGRYRLVKYPPAAPRELLVVDARGNDKEGPGLAVIPGTRIPAIGSYGFPPPPPSAADLEARIEDQAETITRLSSRIRLKDEHHASYPKG